MPVIGNIYVIAGVSVIGGALFGFDISSISAILATNSYRCYFNQGPDGPPFNNKATCSGPTSLRQGGITAAMPAGSWLGALVSGFVSDRLGRKYAIMVGCIFWLVRLPLIDLRMIMLTMIYCLTGLSDRLSLAQHRTWAC